MRLDEIVLAPLLTEAASDAAQLEAAGYDGYWTSESKHDPFLPLAAATAGTGRITLGTAIALAFPRSPMVLAMTAWDIQRASDGRFVLGLGTQVKAHNARRLGVEFDVGHPLSRLRELVSALRHIWSVFQGEHPMRFHGDFYRFDLMTPMFNPGPINNPRIPVYLAAVRARAYRLAGEIADGIHVHPFHTLEYLATVAVPELEKGLALSGRERADITLVAPVFAVVGTGEAAAAEERFVRSQIAFYGSTPAYSPVLEAHGWGDLARRLNEMMARRAYAEMERAISDEVLSAFAVDGASWVEAAKAVRTRYGGMLDRVAFYSLTRPTSNEAPSVAAALGGSQ